MKILVINGPNLNMLGVREPDVYGTMTLAKINEKIADYVGNRATLEFFQSNSEGGIIDKIHSSDADGIVLNAGAYTHYSYAIHDAIKVFPRLLSRCIYPIFTSARNTVTNRLSRRLARVPYAASARTAISLRRKRFCVRKASDRK